MPEEQDQPFTHATEGGVAAIHPVQPDSSVLVGPSTSSEFNTVRAGIIPIACWRVDDLRFAFDSSLVTPSLGDELKQLAQLLKEHPGCPLSVFGHADPVGNDDYNKILSGRRAKAIYGMLTRNTDLWEQLYNQQSGDDNWGIKALQIMLEGLDFRVNRADGVMDESTQQALKDFQTANGLSASGQNDQATRKKLYLAYMNALCGPDLKLRKEDFLARGIGSGGKGDYQGCGEFNPALVFSKEENEAFEKAKDKIGRNRANAPNRRVMVLIFRRGSRVNPSKWPCPRADDGVAGCRKRFWSDGEKRRSNQQEHREYQKTKDTFACRFYDRIAGGSPCESIFFSFRIRLFDRHARPIPFAPYVVVIDGEETPSGQADQNGDILVRVAKTPKKCLVRWSRPKEDNDAPVYAPDSDSNEVPL